MGQEEIVDPGASWKAIVQIERAKLMESTLNSKYRCLIFIDTFRQPIRQDTERAAADQTKESPDPDLNPTELRQATHVTQIQSMADQLKNPLWVSCRRPAFWVGAVHRPLRFQ